jgi:hypothetical protein
MNPVTHRLYDRIRTPHGRLGTVSLIDVLDITCKVLSCNCRSLDRRMDVELDSPAGVLLTYYGHELSQA